MSKKTIRNLIIAVTILIIVATVVAVAFLRVLENSQTLESQIAAVAAQNSQEAALIKLQKIAQSSEIEREELSSYFLLRESDSISFLSEIESLAPTMGVRLQTTDLKQVNQDEKEWVEVSFNTGGRRDNVQNFINVLERIPYASRLIMVNMSDAGNDDWRAEIIIQVQLLSYD